MRVIEPFPKNWPRNIEYPSSHYEAGISWPRITIVTPSFQQGLFIEDTILSVLNQNYPNLEYIIVDGGSTDATVKIIKNYADRLSWWISEPDKGQSDAINKGLEKSTGEIFNWLCSDDMLLPGALHILAKTFMNTNANIVCGWSRQFSDTKDYGLACTSLYCSLPEMFYKSHICQPATWYKMSVFKRLSPVNVQLHFAMDSELLLQYLFAFGRNYIIEIPSVVTAYRYHDSSKTISLDAGFREDKLGLHYAVLKSLDAPHFLLKEFEKYQRSEFHKKKLLLHSEYELPTREILEYFMIEYIPYSKVRRRYDLLIKIILYLIYFNPFRKLDFWEKLLREKIAPKIFK
jgi:glycosyltransferase involved in cell wall biosynthesis